MVVDLVGGTLETFWIVMEEVGEGSTNFVEEVEVGASVVVEVAWEALGIVMEEVAEDDVNFVGEVEVGASVIKELVFDVFDTPEVVLLNRKIWTDATRTIKMTTPMELPQITRVCLFSLLLL